MTITAAPTTIAWRMLTAPPDQTVPPVSHLTSCFSSLTVQ
jgi:hypothetical protein